MPPLNTSEREALLLGIQQLLKVLLISSLVAPALVLAFYGALSSSDTFHQAELRAGHLSKLQEHALKVFESGDNWTGRFRMFNASETSMQTLYVRLALFGRSLRDLERRE